jgi:hypothetical protein
MPFALAREEGLYRLKHGMDFLCEPVPPVSSEMVFFSPRFSDAWFMTKHAHEFRVMYRGEQLPIVPTDSLRFFMKV